MSFKDKTLIKRTNKVTALDYMYPASEKISEGMLDVSKTHSIYYREYGNPKGEVVFFLHGGPGSGCEENDYRFFDPKKYRIILADQRGAGKSRPLAEMKENTTLNLVEDISKLRNHLNITQKAHFFGGSWGCTLALLYAIEHPEHVKSLTLRGVYFGDRLPEYYQADATDLGNPQMIGTGRFFPNEWRDYVNFIPEAERGDMIGAYYKRITRNMPGLSEEQLDQIQNEAATHWATWLGAPMTLHPDPKILERYKDPEIAKSIGSIGIEYLQKNFFLPENYILDNLDKLKDIPTTIVQGRYDMICPADIAYTLHDKLKEAGNTNVELTLATSAHSGRDPDTVRILVETMDKRVKGKHEMKLSAQEAESKTPNQTR